MAVPDLLDRLGWAGIVTGMNIFAWDNNGGPWGKPKPTAKPASKPRVEGPTGARPGPQAAAPQPDLEDVVNQMAERLRGFWRQGRSGGNGGFANVPWQWWGVGLFILWLASGLFVVAPEQQGVVMRFGAYVRTADSGLNYHLPWPVERVVKLPVTRVNLMEIGFRTVEGGGTVDVPEESMMLTGDQNILDLDFTVNWKIADPAAFMFNVANPERALMDVAESVMRETIGLHPVDDALTTNKALIQIEAKRRMQSVLQTYGLGVNIVAVALQQVNPPSEVIDAFRDVQAANADKQRLINEARGYANQIGPLARGEAAKMLQQAEGYKQAKVAEATGSAKRFNEQVEAYQKAPAVTKDRLYLETMQDVLQRTPKVVMTGKGGQNVLPFMPLDRMLKPAVSEGEAR
jgi:membrane protease subunit HflK